jgi:hypothetical protein
MSVTATDFHPLIRPRAPGAPLPVIDVAIRTAAGEFCKRTKCWRTVVSITHEKEWTAFCPTMPAGGVLHELESAYWDTIDEPLTPKHFAEFTPAELDEEGTAPPEFITQLTAGNLRLVPRADGDLVLNVIVAPPDIAASLTVTLPTFMLEVHGAAIAAGALAQLLSMPQEWRDPPGAQKAAAEFEDAVNKMTGRNVRGQQKTRLRMRSSWM